MSRRTTILRKSLEPSASGRKPKKHSSKRNGSRPQLGEVEEEVEPTHPPSTQGSGHSRKGKGGGPVKFYIDDHDDHHDDEKENLLKRPEIVVDPPSENTSLNGDGDQNSGEKC
ncbi:hypothetical protein PoB_005897600 [Plakobranchus ocellatus]|uniref:Uncharacterized protein n=1 Tax=Plakobranchus ocellatus TaxID=259542 RepID=A0AAV4CAZ0_9GAST|nr:hypothetical protein PoB_005897600 [Plakobranchus ocellatus]